tara:strand:+ start:285 stop:524 length:240 start_codon:yes stop_codon:yes gene_type:complete
MKEFQISLRITGLYEEGERFDMDNFWFIDPVSLEELESELSYWLLMYDRDGVDVKEIHINTSEETNVGDEDENALGAAG